MKKSDIGGLIAYVLIIVLALVFCFTVLREYSSSSGITNSFMYWLYIVGSIFAGIILNAILYELAHIAGAKAGRYLIISVNVLGFMFYKKDDKRKFKFASFDGLTGETKIRPDPNASKEPNPRPFLLFGTMFYGFEIIIIITLFAILTGVIKNTVASDIAYSILTMGVVGGAILLYNIIPFQLDSMTDGYRLTLITVNNSKNKDAFNELLRVDYEISQGNTDVEVKTFENITNFTADLNLNKVYGLLAKRDFEEAEKLIDIILTGKGNVNKYTYLRARAQKIFIHLLTKPLEESQKFYNEEVDVREMREISHDVSMPSIRTYILVSGLIDKSKSETILACENVNKAYKQTPEKRREVEVSLYNEALQKVLDTHPSWTELHKYLADTNQIQNQ